jgi:hypothetical protein
LIDPIVSQTITQLNSIESNQQNKCLLNVKSISTPALNNQNNISNQIDINKSRNSSCHSSSSGVSSLSTLSIANVFTSKPSKLLMHEINYNNNKSLNDNLLINKKAAEKSSLTFSFKKLLKIERK